MPLKTSGPVLIVTPDLRFPRGETLEDQSAQPGRYYAINPDTGVVWAGRAWQWSVYRDDRYRDYLDSGSALVPEIDVAEMDLLRAEALYRLGDAAGAAELVNRTRVASGLSATDASGANASCVPRLPDGSCGGLLEMLKWEKRMEVK